MSIISAVDEEQQIIHIKTGIQATDEEFGRNMSELMSVISGFHDPKMLIEYTGFAGDKEKQAMNRVRTFNLETIKYLKKLAIFSPHDLGGFHETLEYCRNRDIPCKNFSDIERARQWLAAE